MNMDIVERLEAHGATVSMDAASVITSLRTALASAESRAEKAEEALTALFDQLVRLRGRVALDTDQLNAIAKARAVLAAAAAAALRAPPSPQTENDVATPEKTD